MIEHRITSTEDGDYHEFVITGDTYDIIQEAATQRWSTKKGGVNATDYDRGIKNTRRDEYRAERQGLFGEMARALFFDKMDEFIHEAGYREGGDDGYDDKDETGTIDVKATGMEKEFWITVEDKERYWGLKSDWYEGYRVVCDSPTTKQAVIRAMGRISKEQVETIEDEPGKRSKNGDFKHWVKKIPFDILEPMPERSNEQMSDYIDAHLHKTTRNVERRFP